MSYLFVNIYLCKRRNGTDDDDLFKRVMFQDLDTYVPGENWKPKTFCSHVLRLRCITHLSDLKGVENFNDRSILHLTTDDENSFKECIIF